MEPYDENDSKELAIFEELFNKIFDSIIKMYMDNNFGSSVIDINDNKFGTNKHVEYSYNNHIDLFPHEKISEDKIKNNPYLNLERDQENPENSEFSVDIIEGDKHITLTVSIPNVEKEDIGLNANDSFLEITINTSKVKYHKLHKLPCNVKPKSTVASYNNGVLDVVMERKEKKNPQKEHKANID